MRNSNSLKNHFKIKASRIRFWKIQELQNFDSDDLEFIGGGEGGEEKFKKSIIIFGKKRVRS